MTGTTALSYPLPEFRTALEPSSLRKIKPEALLDLDVAHSRIDVGVVELALGGDRVGVRR
jgi:hypothetical protein